jgi:hypothetical protein
MRDTIAGRGTLVNPFGFFTAKKRLIKNSLLLYSCNGIIYHTG